ncbi:hypothetical protein D3C81_961950 [compost metagenome]
MIMEIFCPIGIKESQVDFHTIIATDILGNLILVIMDPKTLLQENVMGSFLPLH